MNYFRSRKRYQQGTLELRTRSSGVKVWVYRYTDRATGKRRGPVIGTLKELPTESAALRACEKLRIEANGSPVSQPEIVYFSTVIDRYLSEEIPTRYATGKSYRSLLKNHIRPRWGESPLEQMCDNPLAIREWLKHLPLAGKSKGNIKALLHKLIDCAMMWRYIRIDRNPVSLCTIAGVTKVQKRPTVLTFEQFAQLLEHLDNQPHRTMVILAGATGIRRSELAGLQWGDIDWQKAQLHVRRSWIDGFTDETKTAGSATTVPLDAFALKALLHWKTLTAYTVDTDWVFASPFSEGRQPYFPHKVIEDVNLITPRIGLPRITWHPLRHSYRAWLDAVGASLGTQQRLMRHTDIRTTMNTYGDSLDSIKREMNSRTVDRWAAGLVN